MLNMRTLASVFFCITAFLAVHANTFAQSACTHKIDYELKRSDTGLYSLFIFSQSIVDGVDLDLFDLNTGQTVATKSRYSIRSLKSEAFTGIVPGTYTIIVNIPGCKSRTLGGVTGITIPNTASTD